MQIEDEERRLDPVNRNPSCGQAKGDRMDEEFIDPRTLPAMPSLTRVNFQGRMEADIAECANQGFPVEAVEKTIEILGLNSQRLRRARENLWNDLSEILDPQFENPVFMEAFAQEVLIPNQINRLPKFITTRRSYFGEFGERILSLPPQSWI